MGYKTVTFTQQTERKTFIKGDFKGKYYGSLNIQKSYLNLDFYDIHIYEGQIWNVKNHIDHPSQINETIYESVVSETQLVQGSFKNVISYPSNSTDEFEGFKLNINGPKLESVQITDVVKESRQTFGTIRCEVSGYLSEISEQVDEMEVETCDGCGQFLEECICIEENVAPELFDIIKEEDSKALIISEENIEPESRSSVIGGYSKERTWWSRVKSVFVGNSLSDWRTIDEGGLGCLGVIGILLGGFFLLSLGLPGIVITVLIILIYALGKGTTCFNYLFNRINWILYPLIGIALLGLLLVGIDKCNRPITTIKSTEVAVPEINDESEKIYSSPQIYENTENDNIENNVKRVQLKKIPEIMSGIEFHEGEVFICNGSSSERYHFNPNCSGLSNCSTRIYMINIPEAERRGRTLCKLEY